MKSYKKRFCGVLAFLLAFCALPLSAGAADTAYPQPSATDPAAWYLYGDFDRSGRVDTSDARSILRAAAYLDAQPAADSVKFGSADFDRDGVLTTRDARLALRRALALDPAPAQTPHPYAGKTSVTTTEALAMIRALSPILKPANPENRKPYQYHIKQEYTADIKTGGTIGSLMGDDELKDLLNEMQQDVAQENIDRTQTITTGLSSYINNLQLKGNPTDMIGNVSESAVASTAFSFDANANTYTVRINFKDDTTYIDNTQDSPIRQAISDVNSLEQIKKFADLSGLSEDIKISMEANGQKVHDTVTGAYLEYTINAVNGQPISARYAYHSSIVLPASFGKIGFIETFTITMTTNQSVLMEYTFQG